MTSARVRELVRARWDVGREWANYLDDTGLADFVEDSIASEVRSVTHKEIVAEAEADGARATEKFEAAKANLRATPGAVERLLAESRVSAQQGKPATTEIRSLTPISAPAPAAGPAPATISAPKNNIIAENEVVGIEDFYALMPMHRYIFRPTGELWPAESINTRLPAQFEDGRLVRAAAWLDKHEPVEQVTWAPNESKLIEGRLIDRGGWIERKGCRVYNQYRPAPNLSGDPSKAGLWRAHGERIFPDEWKHIEFWLAHHVQHPGAKVNHCVVLLGNQGVGKDTLLEPVKRAIGTWNWSEISPSQMQGRFNGWAQAVIVRVNEARDMGEFDRFTFYDHSKIYMAAPPDVLRIDEKHLREFHIPNICGILITSNHESDGLYLDGDDRRHFVASSEAKKEDFEPQYWRDIWTWYAAGGIGHVAAYLRALDLSGFDAKAPPQKTDAFWRIVHANAAPEDAELSSLIDALESPDILTLNSLAQSARNRQAFGLADFLTELRSRRSVAHRMAAQGYVVTRNKDSKDGLWSIGGKRQSVYAKRALEYRAIVEAIRKL